MWPEKLGFGGGGGTGKIMGCLGHWWPKRVGMGGDVAPPM